jgi:hypothetical protein
VEIVLNQWRWIISRREGADLRNNSGDHGSGSRQLLGPNTSVNRQTGKGNGQAGSEGTGGKRALHTYHIHVPLLGFFLSILAFCNKYSRNEPGQKFFFSNLAFLSCASPFGMIYEEVTPVHLA